MPVTTFPLIDVKIPPSVNVFYLDTGIAIFAVPSNPEGIVSAFPGSFAIDVAGNWYRKSIGTGNTGWVSSNAGSTSNLVRRLPTDISVVGNIGAGLDTLHTFTLPANSLATDGDYLNVHYSGIFAANSASTKRVVINFGGVVVSNPGLTDITNCAWNYDIRYVRITSVSVLVSIAFMWGNISSTEAAPAVLGPTGSFYACSSASIAVADLVANPQILLVQGESGAGTSNDVVQNLSVIEISQQ